MHLNADTRHNECDIKGPLNIVKRNEKCHQNQLCDFYQVRIIILFQNDKVNNKYLGNENEMLLTENNNESVEEIRTEARLKNERAASCRILS